MFILTNQLVAGRDSLLPSHGCDLVAGERPLLVVLLTVSARYSRLRCEESHFWREGDMFGDKNSNHVRELEATV
jgi:hypothetical protein